MPTQRYAIAEKLNVPIAVVGESGDVRWNNEAFDATFGDDAKHWLKEAARAVAGELSVDAERSLRVSAAGCTASFSMPTSIARPTSRSKGGPIASTASATRPISRMARWRWRSRT